MAPPGEKIPSEIIRPATSREGMPEVQASGYITRGACPPGKAYNARVKERASIESVGVQRLCSDIGPPTSSHILWPRVSFKKIDPTTNVTAATVIGYHRPA